MEKNDHDKNNNNGDFPEEKRKGLLRLTDSDIAPSVRGLIMLLIIFKMITMNSVKNNGSNFFQGLDGVASFGFIIALFLLGMLLWRKYGEPRFRRR